MFMRLFLALVILIGLMWFMGWYGKASPEKRNSAIKTGLLYFVAIALLLLVITGKIPLLFAAISAAIPFLHRIMAYRGIINIVGRFAGKKFGPTTLTTLWLVVEYDLATRSIDGRITQGTFKDKKLSQLSEDELNILLNEVNDDFQSRAAVNAFIFARGSSASSEQYQRGQSADNTNTNITLAQAHEILGLSENTSPSEIKQAHKRLMQKLHPDRGGSSYLATQINAAKDTLLKHYV